jgi:hypothetical protein
MLNFCPTFETIAFPTLLSSSINMLGHVSMMQARVQGKVKLKDLICFKRVQIGS